jgi:hypothetical protein
MECEDARLAREIEEIGRRQVPFLLVVAIETAHLHEGAGVREGKGPEQHGLDQAENRLRSRQSPARAWPRPRA